MYMYMYSVYAENTCTCRSLIQSLTLIHSAMKSVWRSNTCTCICTLMCICAMFLHMMYHILHVHCTCSVLYISDVYNTCTCTILNKIRSTCFLGSCRRLFIFFITFRVRFQFSLSSCFRFGMRISNTVSL